MLDPYDDGRRNLLYQMKLSALMLIPSGIVFYIGISEIMGGLLLIPLAAGGAGLIIFGLALPATILAYLYKITVARWKTKYELPMALMGYEPCRDCNRGTDLADIISTCPFCKGRGYVKKR
jgi:hypothetical protein